MRTLLGVFRRRSVLVGAVMMVWLPLGAGAASAQGLFDFLFGSAGSKQQPAPAQPAPRGGVAPIVLHGSTEYRPLGRTEPSERPSPQASLGRYRTVCVRLCDGYYWPISQDASRGSFYRDAEVCRSACDNEARLFFAPSPGADIAQARDQRGLAYASLDTAFLYRKTRVPGCVCKPVPWSARELGRHRAYAAEEAATKRAAELPSAEKQAETKLADRQAAGEPAREPVGESPVAPPVGIATVSPPAIASLPGEGMAPTASVPALLAPVPPGREPVQPRSIVVRRSTADSLEEPAVTGLHHLEPGLISGPSARLSLLSLTGIGGEKIWPGDQ